VCDMTQTHLLRSHCSPRLSECCSAVPLQRGKTKKGYFASIEQWPFYPVFRRRGRAGKKSTKRRKCRQEAGVVNPHPVVAFMFQSCLSKRTGSRRWYVDAHLLSGPNLQGLPILFFPFPFLSLFLPSLVHRECFCFGKQNPVIGFEKKNERKENKGKQEEEKGKKRRGKREEEEGKKKGRKREETHPNARGLHFWPRKEQRQSETIGIKPV